MSRTAALIAWIIISTSTFVYGQFSEGQRAAWLKRFPASDTNKDGILSNKEANAYRLLLKKSQRNANTPNRGAPRVFSVDPGWNENRFPDHAVCYKTPAEIAEIYASSKQRGDTITSYPKPQDGALRIVGTGHSFMAPGYSTFPKIVAAAGLNQPPLLTHTGGGITGSSRYKWEQENGIFKFDRKPSPKLLASIANAQWDAMMWGPYFQDRPEYYECWIEFCLKYNPEMKFYLSDAWPQLDQLDEIPTDKSQLTYSLIERLRKERHEETAELVNTLNEKYRGKVYVMPTSAAMTLAVKYFHEGKLPGIEGIHRLLGGKDRSLWRDRLGHLGPGIGNLEGYVFYATIYKKSPELIAERNIFGKQEFPSEELDRVFRKIAWEAVQMNPLSGIASPD